jgi:hypothetical protein
MYQGVFGLRVLNQTIDGPAYGSPAGYGLAYSFARKAGAGTFHNR